MNTDHLKQISLFNDLTDQELEEILPMFRHKELTQGIAWSTPQLAFIVSGFIIADVSETNCIPLGQDDMFGTFLYRCGTLDYTPIVNSEIIFLEHLGDIEQIINHSKISGRFQEKYFNSMKVIYRKLEYLGRNKAPGNANSRVYHNILSIAEIMGERKNGSIIIQDFPQQHIMARLSNTTRENISRSIHFSPDMKYKHGSLIIKNYEQFRQKYE